MTGHMNDKIAYSIFDELSQERPFYEVATRWQRLLNLIIDTVGYTIFYIIILFICFLAEAIVDENGTKVEQFFLGDEGDFMFISYTIYVIYFTVLEGFAKGLTLGKRITGTVAVQRDLTPITFAQAFFRSCARLVPFEVISGFTDKTWHDVWTKTMVIKRSRNSTPAADAPGRHAGEKRNS